MDFLFERVAIVGAGLLGASLGLAMQETGAARHVTGIGRRQSSLDKALANGSVHEATLDLAAAVAQADLVVVATPANTVLESLDAIHPHCNASTIVIDVASTKAAICAHASALWQAPRRFIGCHPMAGSEKSGPEHARADLYRNTYCLVEENTDLDPDALKRVVALWERVGATVVFVDSEKHDSILANTSHVPHITASTLAIVAAAAGASRDYVGNGFRDMTRIAEGSPEMWTDISLTNAPAIRAGINDVKAQLDQFLAAIDAGDAERLHQLFNAGKDARIKVLSG